MGKKDILKKKELKEAREKKKEEHVESQISSLKDQYDTFKDMLERYAVKEKDKINSDPLFRADFMKMCRAIGVDPLSSGKGAFKGLFSQTSKEYYYRLATQVSSIWLVLRDKNGGYLSINDCISYLKKISKANEDVTKEDVIKAIQMLGKELKGTFRVIEGDIIWCVPFGMNEDYKRVLECFDEKFTLKELIGQGFSKYQAETVIESMLQNGMIWEDNQIPASSSSKSNIVEGANVTLYWIISKVTDEDDLKENLQEIKNQDDIQDSDEDDNDDDED